jgi:hypothetical protein
LTLLAELAVLFGSDVLDGSATGRRVRDGEAADEAEARLMIARQQDRVSVRWSERAERYRWIVVAEGGKSHHGWADSERDAWDQVVEVLNRPHRGTRYVRRTLRALPPL